MKPSEKLEQIETCYGEFGSQPDDVHKEWLIKRIKNLTAAIEFAVESYGIGREQVVVYDVLRNALEAE